MNDPSTWISLGLLAVTAISIWTTYRLHRDSAGRVTVKMNAAAYMPFLGTSETTTNRDGQFFLRPTTRPSVEMCQVIIDNPGRVGATVTEVEIVIEGTDQVRYSKTPRQFATKSFMGQKVKVGTQFRVKPYDRRVILFDYWSIVDAEFNANPSLREINIYAQVSVAGHPDDANSKKHGYWRIKREYVSAMGSHQERYFRNVLITEFARRASKLSLIDYMDELVVETEEDLGSAASNNDLKDYFDEKISDEYSLHPEEAKRWIRGVAFNASRTKQHLGDRVKGAPLRPHKLKDAAE